tara:strand:+ start:965 stop:1219 length:255 start_codon:yes stop_codon:yes gene_type:complete
MNAYRVKGEMPFGREKQNFTQEVVAKSPEDAKHIILSRLGSRHKVGRRFINIESVKKIKPSESNAPEVINHFRSSSDVAVLEEE